MVFFGGKKFYSSGREEVDSVVIPASCSAWNSLIISSTFILSGPSRPKIYLLKTKILLKNRNFAQKSKFWSKIKILVKNRNFGQKSKFRPTFGSKVKFCSKSGFLVKNRNFSKKNRNCNIIVRTFIWSWPISKFIKKKTNCLIKTRF